MRAYERFLKYVTFDTQSDESSETCPSTAKQLKLGNFLAEELRKLGAKDVEIDENGYVYATVPASRGLSNAKTIALLAHMDTASEMSGKDVKPRIIEKYDGGNIVLNEKLGIFSDPKNFPLLKENIGEDLIVTDGTTLLGADDKAGIADIMTAAESWLSDNASTCPDPELRHPEIRIVFTPDEEIGRGVDKINLEKVNADYGYTVDGEGILDLSYECFNASAGHVSFRGVAVHPGNAFGIMKNASLMAMEFQSMLPQLETPAATQKRMGFFHLVGMQGSVEKAELSYILRDHDKVELDRRKKIFLQIADLMNLKYGDGSVCATITDSYPNMISYILPKHGIVIEAARKALAENGITPDESPVRGGTDGSTLSAMGLPCPNLGTGGQYCHGAHEYASIQGMDKIVAVLRSLARIYAESN